MDTIELSYHLQVALPRYERFEFEKLMSIIAEHFESEDTRKEIYRAIAKEKLING